MKGLFKGCMTIPNLLSLIRILLIPVFAYLFYNDQKIAAVVVLALSGLSDMFDGKIARKFNQVSALGKVLDPVADKFMVIGAMFVLLYKFSNLSFVLIISLIIVVFRELAVTSMRLVVSTGQNIVVAANYLGKIKTVSQIVAVSTVFLEPELQYVIKVVIEAVSGDKLFWRTDIVPLSWITLIFSVVMTIWSGLNYILAYWKYLDPEK